MRKKIHVFMLGGAFLVALFGGGYFYHLTEGWRYLDSLYFIVMTATTVGYGDFSPATDAGKIFTMIFSFVGIALAFFLISQVTSSVLVRHVGKKVGQIKKQVQKDEELKQDIKEIRRKKRAKK